MTCDKKNAEHIWVEDPTMNNRLYCAKCDSVKMIVEDEDNNNLEV